MYRLRLLACSLTLAALLTAADNPSDLSRVVAGASAPDFQLKDGDGREWTLAAERGHPVIVVFYRGHW